MSFDIRVSGAVRDAADRVVPSLVADLVASGVTAQDPTLWGPGVEAHAARRLGWVQAVPAARALVAPVAALRARLVDGGVTRVAMCGMDGAARAAQAIAATAGVDLVVLTEATATAWRAVTADAAHTVLVVAGALRPALQRARDAFARAVRDAGADPAERIVVVAAQGAADAAGPASFTVDPTVYGRFCALTAYALVPAGLAGADLGELVDEADATLLDVAVDSPHNPALVLAAAVAGSAPRRSLLAVVPDGTHLDGVPEWVALLLGQDAAGRGILPVPLLPVSPELDPPPADLVVLRMVDEANAHRLFDRHDGEILVSGSLGAQFVVWQYAAVIIARLQGTDPFDPDPAPAARAAAPAASPVDAPAAGIRVCPGGGMPALPPGADAAHALRVLWSALPPGGVVAVWAYADPDAHAPLAGIRELIAADAGRPTLFSWRPGPPAPPSGPTSAAFLQLVVPDADAPALASYAAADEAALTACGAPVLTLTLTDPQADLLPLFEAADEELSDR